MKVGDEVSVISKSQSETGKIIRFYANQGTVLVELPSGKLVYYSYDNLEVK